jgi:hypothetical protein
MASFLGPGLGDEPDNPYVAYNREYSGDTDYNIIEDELCGIAQMDAWHDHHNIPGLKAHAIKDGVNKYTTKPCDKPANDEDDFLFQKITKNKQYNKYCRVPSDIVFEVRGNILKNVQIGGTDVDSVYEFMSDNILQEIFTPMVLFRYNVLYCDTKVDTGYSKIQAALNSQGIFDDYFLIKDTAKSNYPDDLKKTGNVIVGDSLNNPNQKVTSLLTAQGIYDPGPTTTPYTPSGAEYGFKDANTKSKFGIIDFGNSIESITEYPRWVRDEPYKKYHKFESLLYSKYNNIMVGSTDGAETNVKKYITETNSTFYINDNNNVFYVNKTNSDKATELAELVLTEKLEKIGSHRFPPGTQFPFPEATHIITQSGGKKFFSKKVGDNSQLNKTLCPKIYYKELNVEEGREILENKVTNGIHGFVSFDRVAIVTSLFHGSPIVIFSTTNGFVIFISKNLINKISSPATIYEKTYKEFETKKQKITQMYNEHQTFYALISRLDTLESTLNTNKASLIGFLNSVNISFTEKVNAIHAVARGRSSVKSDSYDREYKLWLSKLYIYNQLGNAFGNLKKNDVLSGNSLEQLFNDAIAIDTISDYANIKVDYDDYNSRKTSDVPANDNDIIINIKTINEKIIILDDNIKKFTILNNYLDEIKLINNIYITEITKYKFETILALNTNVNDEKIINKYLKEQNPQIADSISGANISAGFQNPSCASSLFSFFGSSKIPHFGPIHEICKYYQYIPNTIIDSYKNFLEKIKSISNVSLYEKQLTYLRDKITKDGGDSNDSDEHILNLSDETRTNISGCYNAALAIQSGGEQPRKKIKIEDFNLQEYLEFNSFVCILQFYSYIIQYYSRYNFNIQIINDIITHGLSSSIIKQENGNIIGCNEIINNEILKKLSIETFTISIETFTKLQQDLHRITNLYVNNTFNEITSYNLFVNNIVGLFNIKLFKLIILTLIKNNVYTKDVINKRNRDHDDDDDIKLTSFAKEEIQIQIDEMVNYINRNKQNAYKNYYSFISFKTNIIDVIENHPEKTQLIKQIEVLYEITNTRDSKINGLINELNTIPANEITTARNPSTISEDISKDISEHIKNIINNINNTITISRHIIDIIDNINNTSTISNRIINIVNDINNTSDIDDIFIDYFDKYINSDQLMQRPGQQQSAIQYIAPSVFPYLVERPLQTSVIVGGNSKKNRRTKKKTSKSNKKNTRKAHSKKSNKRTKRKSSK